MRALHILRNIGWIALSAAIVLSAGACVKKDAAGPRAAQSGEQAVPSASTSSVAPSKAQASSSDFASIAKERTRTIITKRTQSHSTSSQISSELTVTPGVLTMLRMPEASGTRVYKKNGITVDASHTTDGYFMVRHELTEQQLRIEITKNNVTYGYDLGSSTDYETFPLQMGDGVYQIVAMSHLSGNYYNKLCTFSLVVHIKDEAATFLYPNQYVCFDAQSLAAQTSYTLCKGIESDADKIRAIYSYIVGNIRYDFEKAQSVRAGYVSDVDRTLRTKKGICVDYAALFAAMLRAQGIPAKMVTGEVSGGAQHHAWNSVYVSQAGQVTDHVYLSGPGWVRLDPTFAAAQNDNAESYVGDGKNYAEQKYY